MAGVTAQLAIDYLLQLWEVSPCIDGVQLATKEKSKNDFEAVSRPCMIENPT